MAMHCGESITASVAFTFLFYKVVQLASVAYYGLLTTDLLRLSVVLTVAAVAAFAVGLRVQDRMDQRAFNRAALGFLAGLGAWLVVRAIWF